MAENFISKAFHASVFARPLVVNIIMTVGAGSKLITLPSRQDMILVQSVLDSLSETHGGNLSQQDHSRLTEIMGDVQHHLRRCVKYEVDEESGKHASTSACLDGVPSLADAQADLKALEEQVMSKAARVRELNDRIPAMTERIVKGLNEAAIGGVDLPGEALGGEVQSASLHLKSTTGEEVQQLTRELPGLQRSIMESTHRLKSHLEVLQQKRGLGSRREKSLLPDTAPTNPL